MSFPSLKAQQFIAVVSREPLCYQVTKQKGSHRRFTSENGYPEFSFSFHDRATLPPGVVRKYLVQIIGLTDKEAKALI